jgi:D-alanine-D-alanine ligase
MSSRPSAEWSVHDVLDGLTELGIKADWLDPTEPEFADNIRGYDVAFINCHGDFGEDGTLQGLLTYLGIPYTGSGVATSSIAADKRLTKLSLSESGVELAEYHRLIPGSRQEYRRVRTPVMLKSVNGGSSVGMELVTATDQLEAALLRLQRNGFGDVIAESFVEGVSVTVPVIHVSGRGIMLPPVVCESQREYYDEYSKLSGDQEGAVSYHALTDPGDERITLLHDAVRKVAGTLDFDGAMRVDFIMREHGRPVLLEINTVPGVQQGSNLMLSAQAAGLDYPTVLGVVLSSAQRARLAPWTRQLEGSL